MFMTDEQTVDLGAIAAQYDGLSEASVFELNLVDRTETIALGELLGQALHGALTGHDLSGVFVGLIGGLGAGKTTFMQGFVSGIDADAEATSPTYALVNVYDLDVPVIHMDLYRLEHLDDLESIGYWDYVESDERVLCVEWIDRIPQAWPGEGILLALMAVEGSRQIRMWASPDYVNILSSVCESFEQRATSSI